MKRNLWLLAAVVLCAVSLWAGIRGRGDAGTSAPPPVDPAVHLLVLNGTSEAGLARDLSRDLAGAGLVVGGVGNTEGEPAAATVLVNRRLDDAVARRLAARLGGLPVVREWDGRCSEDAVLVLGSDWVRVREALAGGS